MKQGEDQWTPPCNTRARILVTAEIFLEPGKRAGGEASGARTCPPRSRPPSSRTAARRAYRRGHAGDCSRRRQTAAADGPGPKPDPVPREADEHVVVSAGAVHLSTNSLRTRNGLGANSVRRPVRIFETRLHAFPRLYRNRFLQPFSKILKSDSLRI